MWWTDPFTLPLTGTANRDIQAETGDQTHALVTLVSSEVVTDILKLQDFLFFAPEYSKLLKVLTLTRFWQVNADILQVN